MASITKVATGFRAQVYVKGERDSRTFRTKREAAAWAAAREAELHEQVAKPASEKHTLADALEKYRDEVAPTKRGVRHEAIRINAMLASPLLPTGLPLAAITPAVLGDYRDARLKSVAAGTVLREFKTLTAVFEEARREWEWIKENPVRDVRKPRAPAHRDRLIARSEIRRQLTAMGYRTRGPVKSVSQGAAVAFLVALRTGMRAGEICGLTWDQVFDGYCHLPETKTVKRDVPLSRKAQRLIERMRGFDSVLVFGLSASTLDALFRRYRQRAGLGGFTFHDARHTAATWMARKVDVLTLCKIFGWANPKQAMTYYNPKAADIAKLL